LPSTGSQDLSKAEQDIENGMKRMKGQVHYVQAVSKNEGWRYPGKGDIVIDSTADESCWPAGWEDAYPLKEGSRRMVLKTASGGGMAHHGQTKVSFKYEGGKNIVGLAFHVADVKKPLLAVRRSVENGTKVALSEIEGECRTWRGSEGPDQQEGRLRCDQSEVSQECRGFVSQACKPGAVVPVDTLQDRRR
jgi:hypothetical protein